MTEPPASATINSAVADSSDIFARLATIAGQSL
jgi:hypothetical protein